MTRHPPPILDTSGFLLLLERGLQPTSLLLRDEELHARLKDQLLELLTQSVFGLSRTLAIRQSHREDGAD